MGGTLYNTLFNKLVNYYGINTSSSTSWTLISHLYIFFFFSFLGPPACDLLLNLSKIEDVHKMKQHCLISIIKIN